MRVANCVRGSSVFAISCRLLLRPCWTARTAPTPATTATVLRLRLPRGDASEQRLDCGAHFLLQQVPDHGHEASLSRHRPSLRVHGFFTSSTAATSACLPAEWAAASTVVGSPQGSGARSTLERS